MVTTSAPSAATGTVATADLCLLVDVEVAKSFWDVDHLWLGLGFLIGFLIGAAIAICIVILCLKDNAKRRRQDEEERSLFGEDVKFNKHGNKVGDANMQDKLIAAEKLKKKRSNKKKKLLSLKKKKKAVQDEEGVDIAWVDLGEGDKGETAGVDSGLVEAATKTTSEGMEAEISNQDLTGVLALETEHREERLMAMINIIRLLLLRLVSKGKISNEFVKEKTKEFQESINTAARAAQDERDEKEEELKKNDKLKKDPVAMERELEKLHPAYVQRLNILLKEEIDKLKHDMNSKTDLSDDEIDALMAEYHNNMAKLDQKLAAERTRHTMTLEEKLARRRHLAQQHQVEADQNKKEAEFRTDEHEKTLSHLMEDSKLLERQKEELLQQFDEEMKKLAMRMDEEKQKQELHLAEKLKNNREARFKKLSEEHERQREEFLQQTSRSSQTASSFVDSMHGLLEQQRVDEQQLSIDLDAAEAQELKKLRHQLDEDRFDAMEQKDVEMKQNAFSVAQVSQRDIDKLLRVHNQQMEHLQNMRAGEKRRMNAILEEKLAQKRMKADEEQRANIAEQQALDEQQNNMVNKVLSQQMDLADDAKERILREHEQNMQAVHNQLEMSKLRQNKQLEQKLAERRARLASMKQEAEQNMAAKAGAKQKERDKLEKEWQKKIEEEEQKMEDDRKQQMAALRQRLAEETSALLAEEENKLGMLIASQQVGAARRQAIIQKQDKTIKELEEQLAGRVEEGGVSSTRHVDQLLQHHQNQVEQLNEQLQASRDHHEQVLMEKLQTKRLKKERDLERKLEGEAQEEWLENKKRGAGIGIATSILSQSMLEQRHKAALQQLEREMEVEMHKQRDELDAELQRELQQELQDQKKAFLAQLAALSNMSHQEVTDIVSNAVADTGGDEKQAKKLAKELRTEMKRAKTDLGIDDRRGLDYPDYRRSRTGMDDEYEPEYRPRSSKRGRPKSAFRSSEDL